MALTFKRDSKGLGEVLKSAGVKKVIHSIALETERHIQGQVADAETVVDDYVTDRAASSVTLKRGDDKPGKRLEVESGVLSKAAAQAGLQVTLRR